MSLLPSCLEAAITFVKCPVSPPHRHCIRICCDYRPKGCKLPLTQNRVIPHRTGPCLCTVLQPRPFVFHNDPRPVSTCKASLSHTYISTESIREAQDGYFCLEKTEKSLSSFKCCGGLWGSVLLCFLGTKMSLLLYFLGCTLSLKITTVSPTPLQVVFISSPLAFFLAKWCGHVSNNGSGD